MLDKVSKFVRHPAPYPKLFEIQRTLEMHGVSPGVGDKGSEVALLTPPPTSAPEGHRAGEKLLAGSQLVIPLW